MKDLFDMLSNAFNPAQKLKTNLGEKVPMEIISHLEYCSYKANRELGIPHESLVKIGIGNLIMKEKYESESNGNI